ncbi:putative cathepsin B1 cysteine protease [Monocercomonoides exilis]|uniref:putative cathepsin B1 cysteine protease n=1 Tax=Monocercomonoides exilis TaxID=2049356 RepID=UPI00355A15B3|nr:putative cathepsin B1 cysteine protease [Monocercomonoides exilis]|eukprot:MONOS_12277.1-p1 / transcript=MONOS_12277.1 / gene=MONOS_12277 / organism=Monocercomonoides_exilis_PA203 / gene_product=cathepsin B1 cysteine protease / transcript_product=cathepsin B1 cysteine protease / location=Mono_scaffold00669:27434-29584(+) / protein_length=686 / sequence_SO=supercontig / SO=protein_coding / is_pseudo=false
MIRFCAILLLSVYSAADDAKPSLYTGDQPLPKTFDLRDKYPECTPLIRPLNQGSCGSCWAFSTTSVAADRFCINGYTNQQMAAEHQIQCDINNGACNGGYINKAFEFQVNTGLVPLSCKSYRDATTRRCSQQCDDQSTIDDSMVYKMDSYKSLFKRDDHQATLNQWMEELFLYGSFAASYMVTDKFQAFYNDHEATVVYTREDDAGGQNITYHAIKVIGYGDGVDKNGRGVPYWLIQNSWGHTWADGGYFRLERGNMTCDIETDGYAPEIQEYYDECSKHITCDECKSDPSCGYCVSSDMCVTINPETGKQKKGMCPTMLSKDSVCPLDDCIQFSKDPQRCLSHKGCFFCAQNNKCKKGDRKTGTMNSGTCVDPITSKAQLIKKYPCVQYKEQNECLNVNGDTKYQKKCVWCHQHNLCLDNNVYSTTNKTLISSCSEDYFTVDGNWTAPQNFSCSDFSFKACLVNDPCKWDYHSKQCVNGSAPSDPEQPPANRLMPVKYSRSANMTQRQKENDDASSSERNEEVCLSLSCDACTPEVGCLWCHSTQSCVAISNPSASNSNSLSTYMTSCTVSSSNGDRMNWSGMTTTRARCDPCSKHASCIDCAKQAECGWFSQASMCVMGKSKSSMDPKEFGAQFENDTFIAYQMNCPVVLAQAEGAHFVKAWSVSIISILTAFMLIIQFVNYS